MILESSTFGIANADRSSVFLLPPTKLLCRLQTEKVNGMLQSDIVLTATTNFQRYLNCWKDWLDS